MNAPASLRIVHVLRAPVGGLFRHVCDLARAQAARGHRIGVIADSLTGGTQSATRLSQIGPLCALGVRRVAMPRLPGIGDVAAICRVRRILGGLGPDVVHGHGAKGGAYARLCAPGAGGRMPVRVYTPHGGSLHYAPGTPAGLLYFGIERVLARRTDLFLFESAYGRRVFEERIALLERPATVVHNGLSDEDFTPVPPAPDAADFLFVGELRHLKGVDVLLAALARIAGARAVIVGAGPDADALADQVRGLGLSGRVRFTGAMPARSAFMLGRCLVVPSRAESLPYIVLEGAAARLPVIATNVGGMTEIFGEQAGRLVAPGDDGALERAMRAVLGDPGGARADAEALAARVAEHFTADAMAEAVLTGYRTARGLRSD